VWLAEVGLINSGAMRHIGAPEMFANMKVDLVAMQEAKSALSSKSWVDSARAIQVLQQIAAHHSEILRQNLCVPHLQSTSECSCS
jgi:hypothetical protein